MFRTLSLALLMSALPFWMAQARADSCTVYKDANQTGLSRTFTLPEVTASASGTAWGETAISAQDPTLSSVADVSSVRIVAQDSDVYLYAYDGKTFSGNGLVARCQKGRVCAINYARTGVEDRIHSIACQREFARKAVNSPKDNAIIDLKLLADAAVKKAAKVSSRIKWVHALATTVTEYEYCKAYPDSACAAFPANKYRDVVKLHVWGKVETGPRDVEFYIDFYGRFRPSGVGNRLGFDVARISYDTWGSGALRNRKVKDEIRKFLRGYDLGADVRKALDTLAAAGFKVDGNQRLQFSIFEPADLTKPAAAASFKSTSTQPKLVLNQTRDAAY